ncbi:NAD(P)H:quinone oxidoreductase, type IV [Allomyces macrogynus ATCC 38327]|uniref:NAD(P)H:quinone oxidoreductase, type IV n=1 Tax=Allomyces macrogynus (strain ATCC 38327) TaxID=578462 RepID=A0A0L0TE77_ALLM3|nr:NAD(P)H:quinone oxidoreductase, type IV [Allomyces macrogynus ATCC 38327]|eukprot:KNE73183.1 NAD(P)H:quinone oxidoreductase, type IV [Allomyces macrogynus ATCC 38327]
MAQKAKIAIITYSLYHHVHTLAKSVKAGIDATGHAEATIFRIAETLSPEILTKMHAPPAPDVPIATPETLTSHDGFVFGIPTRFGMLPAQLKAYFDSTGQLWATGALQGKPASIFVSTATQHGGHETTALATLPYFAHLGLIYVPLGAFSPNGIDEMTGGSPWGAGTIAGGDGSRQPSAKELETATAQGKHFATVTAKLVNGAAALV